MFRIGGPFQIVAVVVEEDARKAAAFEGSIRLGFRRDGQAGDRDHRQLVRRVALVRVADVEFVFVLDGVGIAEVRTRIGYAGAAGEDGGANDEDFAEDGFARLAHGNSQG